ncbi:hypothetical protein DK68_2506 [Brucella suis]|nr:hypothetical protein C050_00454 [Brucella suis 92/63]ENR27751.1 hypothetical protein C978_00459 [Brucella suis 94/11]ENR34024.1 hypothetical protein C006_01107 [Brucella suis F5/03-2]ENT34575.1 hypothetical protein C039_00452 [Brucella suis 63/261]ENT40726.1 hypothetical protein C049_00486 [Brucella suis F12/02]ENT44228.1 hypothetical protein B986_01329 [Brucella suis F5/05-10]ENT45749.1 hypothetical protein B969_00816 [Brucella suis F5/05-4]ENT51697.1 hypothetical protein C000_00813 [Bru
MHENENVTHKRELANVILKPYRLLPGFGE